MNEKDIMELIDNKLNPIILQIAEINLNLQSLREEFNAFKKSEQITGVYLDGCPEYAQKYIENDDNTERGE